MLNQKYSASCIHSGSFNMKFAVVLLLVAFVAVQAEEEVSQEGIFSNIGKLAKKHLGKLAKTVGRDILNQAKEIVTDHFKIKPTPEIQEALVDNPSQEAIYHSPANYIGDIIFKKADELSKEEGPSHEGIFDYNMGFLPHIHEAEDLLGDVYIQNSHNSEGPSHEGIFGNLGKLVIKNFGNLIGGKVGGVIGTAGDVIGNLFFAAPPGAVSHEALLGHENEVSQEGIFSGLAKVITKGAGKVASGILGNVLGSASDVLGNIFMARGTFRSYSTVQAPAHEIIQRARKHLHEQNHPAAAQACLATAEHNFTMLFNEYVKQGDNCVAYGHNHAHQIFHEVKRIVVDSVHRVENAHREAGYCFKSKDQSNCLENDLPALIAKHEAEIHHYQRDLTRYVKEMTLLNNNFDVCLVQHLGYVRDEIYHIIEEFHFCLEKHETE